MTDKNIITDTLTGSEPLSTRNKERFCLLYVTSPYHVGAIYREAGYKPTTNKSATEGASRLLKDVNVQRRIAFLRHERDERIGRNADDVVAGLFDMRDKCAGGVIVRDRQGNPITIDINILGVKQRHAVLWKPDVAGFNRASELLARYFGILTDKVVVDDVRKLAEKYDNEAEDIIETMLNSDKMIYVPTKKDGTVTNETVIPVDESGKVDESVKRKYSVVDETGKEHRSDVKYPLRKDNGDEIPMA